MTVAQAASMVASKVNVNSELVAKVVTYSLAQQLTLWYFGQLHFIGTIIITLENFYSLNDIFLMNTMRKG